MLGSIGGGGGEKAEKEGEAPRLKLSGEVVDRDRQLQDFMNGVVQKA
jgi:hypothetical protein